MATERGVLVDDLLRTSDPDIYAAGDVCEILDAQSGKRHLDSLWWLAAEGGRVAGKNMAGGSTRHRPGIPFNVTSLAGLTTTILGAIGQHDDQADLLTIARGDSETWRATTDGLTVDSGGTHTHLRLVIGRCALLGAVVIGDQSLSRPLQTLIRQQVDITPICPALMAEPTRAAELIAEYWTKWSSAHAA